MIAITTKSSTSVKAPRPSVARSSFLVIKACPVFQLDYWFGSFPTPYEASSQSSSSRYTVAAAKSSLIPLKLGCHIMPSRVQQTKEISHTNSGLTQCAAAFPIEDRVMVEPSQRFSD